MTLNIFASWSISLIPIHIKTVHYYHYHYYHYPDADQWIKNKSKIISIHSFYVTSNNPKKQNSTAANDNLTIAKEFNNHKTTSRIINQYTFEVPGKKAVRNMISAKIHPIAHISTPVQYWGAPNNSSGLRYHLHTGLQYNHQLYNRKSILSFKHNII